MLLQLFRSDLFGIIASQTNRTRKFIEIQRQVTMERGTLIGANRSGQQRRITSLNDQPVVFPYSLEDIFCCFQISANRCGNRLHKRKLINTANI
jgi:nitrate reductase cytochrome c-type subunit